MKGEVALVLVIFLLIVLFYGDPDFHDLLIERLQK